MNRYIRTKDGRIVDIQRFIDEEKDTPYYYDFEFDEIKNEEDYCVLNWTAVGSKENSIKEQVGKRCQFGVTISSPFIAQADTIEELCNEFVAEKYGNRIVFSVEDRKTYETRYCVEYGWNIYGAIWTEKGLIYVAKMNEKGDLELL